MSHTRTRYDGEHARVACTTAYEHSCGTIGRAESKDKFRLHKNDDEEKEEEEEETERVAGEGVAMRRRRCFSAMRVNGKSAT